LRYNVNISRINAKLSCSHVKNSRNNTNFRIITRNFTCINQNKGFSNIPVIYKLYYSLFSWQKISNALVSYTKCFCIAIISSRKTVISSNLDMVCFFFIAAWAFSSHYRLRPSPVTALQIKKYRLAMTAFSSYMYGSFTRDTCCDMGPRCIYQIFYDVYPIACIICSKVPENTLWWTEIINSFSFEMWCVHISPVWH
jgi:hypothetical protein